MRYTVLSVILVLMISASSRADLLDLSNAPELEKYELTFSYKGIDFDNPPKTPFSLRYTIGNSSLSATVENKFVGEGSARHMESRVTSTTHNGCKQTLFFRFKPGDKLSLEYFERTSFSPSGKKIISESYLVSDLVPPVPENAVQPFTLPLAVRAIDFTPGKKYNIYLWFGLNTVFAMDLIVKGEEVVTVPAGTFKCHRVDLIPDLVDLLGPLIGRFVKSFVPKVTVWFGVDEPHRLVKYTGPFGMMNIDSSQRETFELKKIIN